MRQGLLVADAGALDDLRDRVEHLAGDPDGLEQVGLPGGVNHLLPRIEPVEVHHGLLQAEEIVDGADDQVD